MDIITRNAGIKRLLVARYGNVRVTGGKGSSYGWVHIRFPGAVPDGVTRQSIVRMCNDAGLHFDVYYTGLGGNGESFSIHSGN